MLDEEDVKKIAHDGDLSQTTRLLLCLAVGDQPKSVTEIREIAVRAGIAGAKKWNTSGLLSASKGKAINTPSGWELSGAGKQVIEPLTGPLLASAPPKAATALRAQLAGITDPHTRSFVEQAISCFEHQLYRAAVVLSWVGAVSLLYEHVIAHELAAFNAEARQRYAKKHATWKNAKTRDDLALMQESEFLQILETLSVVGKSVKAELEACLKLRNGCGHPNSLHVAEHRVSSHIEILTLNVFAKF